MTRTSLLLTLFVVLMTASAAFAEVKRPSKTCGTISGYTELDAEHLATFCGKWILRGMAVVDASARDMSVWINIRRPFADQLIEDRLTTEQLIKGWMAMWRKINGKPVATIHVIMGDIDIAKGETTLLSGDKVTIRQR